MDSSSSLDDTKKSEQARVSFAASDSQKIIFDDGIKSVSEGLEKIKNGPAARRESKSAELRKAANSTSNLSDKARKILGGLESDVASVASEVKSITDATKGWACFKHLFLNPSYSLQKQMLLTFGGVSTLTILVIMIAVTVATVTVGNNAAEESEAIAEALVRSSLGSTARYVAEAISPRIMPVDVVNIMQEFLLDRFVGYPNFEDDSQIPFFDLQSQKNVYPLAFNPLPLDWDFRNTPGEAGNVNNTNYEEHLQGRLWLTKMPKLSTANAYYSMQGACDPRSNDDPTAFGHYPNCTAENNNYTTGGVVAPTPTNGQIFRKASSLSPLLKSLFEYHKDIQQLGFYFSNSGAGSYINFPHYPSESNVSFTSIGCDWMRELNPVNPALGPIGTEEEIARCHKSGESVPLREYNPMERGWCRDQALNPNRVHNIGPYSDAADPGMWMITAGRSVYDPITGAFVACILLDFTTDSIRETLNDVDIEEWSEVALYRWDDGSVVMSQHFDFNAATDTAKIDDPSLETGIDSDMFHKMKTLVDFTSVWIPSEAREAYETTSFESNELIVYAYPIPAIPDEYDPLYYPEFISIVSIQKDEGLTPVVERVGETIDEQVQKLVVFTLVVGFCGIFVIILIIYGAAFYLTEPLKWMCSVGNQVMTNFGGDLGKEINYERKERSICSPPKTELSFLVNEFVAMISRFSGDGTAKRSKKVEEEVLNEFNLGDEFATLYERRKSAGFAYDYSKTTCDSNNGDHQNIVKEKIHRGRNVLQHECSTTTSDDLKKSDTNKTQNSSLFIWIVFLVVGPLLVFSITISAVVLWNLSTFPALLDPLKVDIVSLNDNYRFTSTALRSSLTSTITERAVRDLHIITRYATWIAFGALNTSNTIAPLLELSEECKVPGNELCTKLLDEAPCDCDWNDAITDRTCANFQPGNRSRPLQNLWFSSQSDDAWPDGTRNFTSFPSVAYSSETTSWWDDVSYLPGPKEGYPNPKYSASFSRAKIFSSMSSVLVPLYRYDTSKNRPMQFFLSFEADGMVIGYSGCTPRSVEFPPWSSTENNGASKVQPELCPVGKYGYDPRCRSWYDNGKKKSQVGEFLEITSPYLFADNRIIAQTATTPVINPRTNEYLGQTLVDFIPNSLISLLKNNTKLSPGGFSILVTVPSGATVLGPGYSLDQGEKAINELVCSKSDLSDCRDFENLVLESMKKGLSGRSHFTRETDGGKEKVHISYSPVVVKNYHAVDAADFSSGVNQSHVLIYSLALAEPEEGMLLSFESMVDFTQNQVKICIVVISACLALALPLLLYIAYRVATSLTAPILNLLVAVKEATRSSLEGKHLDSMGEHKGSCKEIVSVYHTMEMLLKVIHIANDIFYSGDLELSYRILKDSLRMFTAIKNKKAMAIASTNMGNIMLTSYRQMVTSVKSKENSSGTFCGLTVSEIVAEGEAYFTVAITLGEKEYDSFYDSQGWSEECLAFMQSLSNRYFNRALFLLTSRNHHHNPKDAEISGFRDIQITSDMDLEIVDQCEEMGFKIDRVERHELMMSRSRGILALIKLGYSPEEFFIDDVINELVKQLSEALKNPGSELFRDLSPAGRMQLLDVELMKYLKRAKKNLESAAIVATRMLVEDEYVILSAHLKSLKTLLAYLRVDGDEELKRINEKRKIEDDLIQCVVKLEAEFDRYVSSQSRESIFSRNSSILDTIRQSTMRLGSDFTLNDSVMSVEKRSTMKETSRGDFIMEEF